MFEEFRIIKMVETKYRTYETTLGNLTHQALADYLGVSPSTLYQRIRKYGIHDMENLLVSRYSGNTGRPTEEYRNLGNRPRNLHLLGE